MTPRRLVAFAFLVGVCPFAVVLLLNTGFPLVSHAASIVALVVTGLILGRAMRRIEWERPIRWLMMLFGGAHLSAGTTMLAGLHCCGTCLSSASCGPCAMWGTPFAWAVGCALVLAAWPRRKRPDQRLKTDV